MLQKTRRRITRAAAVLAATTVVAASSVVGAPAAQSLTPNTVFFNTLSDCKNAKFRYSNSFTRISQDCTYAGAMFLWIKLDPGPYFLVFTARTR